MRMVLVALTPVLAALAVSAWVAIGWASGENPFWADPHMTVSEAAGLASSGEVVRLVRNERQDPSQPWSVRDGILGVAQTVTPLEAAVAVRQFETVRVLLDLGARPRSPGERLALICRAVDAQVQPIVDALLATGDRSDPRADCRVPR